MHLTMYFGLVISTSVSTARELYLFLRLMTVLHVSCNSHHSLFYLSTSVRREVVDGMLENHMHDALLCNDQLTMLMRFNRIFSGFVEGPLNFFPTYKFDHDSGERAGLHETNGIVLSANL